MGLDTTHDCWHGPYSSFMAWRRWLHYMAAPNPGRSLEAAWEAGDYEDQSIPINVLMAHSDCCGEISAADCGPLADALQAILDEMPSEEEIDHMRRWTKQFIAGLRSASAAGEAVEFG